MIHKYFLPKISRILKLRRKKITMSQDDLSCEVLTKMDGVCSTIPTGWCRATAFPFLLALILNIGKALKAMRSISDRGRPIKTSIKGLQRGATLRGNGRIQ